MSKLSRDEAIAKFMRQCLQIEQERADLLEMCKRLRIAIVSLGNDMNWPPPMGEHFGDGILTDLNLLIDEADKEAA